MTSRLPITLILFGQSTILSNAVASNTVPAVFACNRIHVEATTATGQSLRFFTDTGGGTWLLAAAVKRAGLVTTDHQQGQQSMQTVAFPQFMADAGIPAVDAAADPRMPELAGKLLVMPQGHPSFTDDGMLGQEWFGGRIWRFDYGNGRLAVLSKAPSADAHTVQLGFPKRPDGSRGTHFPSIEARIDGQLLPMLLDTGATISASGAAGSALGLDGAGLCATSFIVASIFDRWRADHPDWRVIDGADQMMKGEPMIEVPAVQVAGHTVGPVWFTRRADSNFHDFMSSMMDRKVDGALGGSLLRYFVITVDYPAAQAHFQTIATTKDR